MKRFLALLVTIVILISLAACGGSTPQAPAQQIVSQQPGTPSVSEPLTESEVPAEPATPAESDNLKKPERPKPVEVPECTLAHLPESSPNSRGEVKNILMIGNSFCFYFVEELYGIASAAGYDPTIVNVYEAGCSMEEHWKYYLQMPVSHYDIWQTDSSGRVKTSDSAKLSDALESADWDIISLQQHFPPALAYYSSAALESCEPYATELLASLRQSHPDAELFWQQTWAYQTDYSGMDPEKQTRQHNNIRLASRKLCEDHKIALIPSGDAWQLARANPQVGDTLCKDDFYHDGDVGGGQYLNACVWFEVLFGESCIGNTWRPQYALSEEKIIALQQAAHEAVAALYGEEYFA